MDNEVKTEIAMQTTEPAFPEMPNTAWIKSDSNAQDDEGTLSTDIDEKQQRGTFRKWYANTVGTANSASTISTAIGKTRLKNGKAIFAITSYGELATAIKAGGLEGYFDTRGGGYKKLNDIFEMDPSCEKDDLKSGIKHYLAFLKSAHVAFTPAAPMKKNNYPTYTEADFLNEVYINAEQYATLKGLLLRKKNLILQGAPGVGKTFAARRLAFSIMGKKDMSRIKMIQFHQSYSYEDFMMGYRPNENGGFYRAEGPFYEFCKTAENDDGHRYFFIIDEINRGNLSKIFGELLMLIESDKRGDKNSLRLLYKDEQFSVPDNVYIIGMMNTADRSLAMIDYALRRRFAFFDLKPAFQSDGFKKRQTVIRNSKFDTLIATVESLSEAIGKDDSLGKGFRIGHSYFCTEDTINDAWLSSVIEYELIPLLEEYWFDEPPKVKNWVAELRGVLNA